MIASVSHGQADEPVQGSSRSADTNARFSPDGRRIAFGSSRSGTGVHIWVANADGSQPRQLTRGPGRYRCSPTWSPDGRRAFDSRNDDGRWHAGSFPAAFTISPDERTILYARRIDLGADLMLIEDFR